mmetsp:Transcript_15611/g.32960  ORF Transcript_15611/g.32960 Transcript_15611/m.32960 type:complete len:227 (+) Transcript_15611:108-788(+)
MFQVSCNPYMVGTGLFDDATFFFFLGTKMLIDAACDVVSVVGADDVSSSAVRFFSMVVVSTLIFPSIGCSCCTAMAVVTRVGAIFFFFFLGTSVLMIGCVDVDGWDRSSAGVAKVTFFSPPSSLLAGALSTGATVLAFFFGTNVWIVTPFFNSDSLAAPSFSSTFDAASLELPTFSPTFSTTFTTGGTYTSPNSPIPKLKMLTYPSELVTNKVRPSDDQVASVNPA